MRLLKLKVRNIASLKGEHEVDFEDIASRSHLFAITGETGAGKSSLLNSIALALYGKVFKSNVIQNDLVTLGEKEGQIELIFDAKGKYYVAFWRARVLKSNGEPYSTPQSPTRELYEIEGKDFSATRNITTQKIEDILNLDFDQFCKCIILNQGEFARFLLSTFTERKAILEKLYPGEMLENLSRELKGQLDALNAEKNEILVGLETLRGESGPQENIADMLQSLEEKLKLTEAWFSLMEGMHKHFTSLQTYHHNHSDYQNKILATQKDFSAETTLNNLLLKKCEDAALIQSEAKEELEKRQPRLEELLKLEVKLLHDKKELQKAEKEKTKIKEKLATQTTRQSELIKEESLKVQANTEITQKILYPLDDLLGHRSSLSDLFELWNHKTHLDQELKLLEKNLSDLEIRGKDEAQLANSLEQELAKIPADSETKLIALQNQRSQLNESRNLRLKSEAQLQECSEQIHQLSEEVIQNEKKEKELSDHIKKSEIEISPLQTSLKLQEIITAVKTCLHHEESRNKGECPVCTNPLPQERWDELAVLSAKNDFTSMQTKVEELKSSLIKLNEELRLGKERIKFLLLNLNEKKNIHERLLKELASPLPDPEGLDKEIALIQKLTWDREKITKDHLKAASDLQKTRRAYKELKESITLKKAEQENKLKALQEIESTYQSFIKSSFTEEIIQNLKSDSRNLALYLDLDQKLQKLRQELIFLATGLSECTMAMEEEEKQIATLNLSIANLTHEIKVEVQDETPTSLLEKLRQKAKDAQDNHQKLETELKQHQLKLKEFQSKLYAYDEQIKATEVVFASELHEIRNLSQHTLVPLNQEFTETLKKLKALALSLTDIPELFVPFQDLLSRQKEELKHLTNQTRSDLAAARARLEDWEKRKDKIRLLELSLADIQSKSQRLGRLSEVLGKDELRSFVLSLVEENLIYQTNQELGRLCQGRYEIIHQNKGKGLTPEFYILDKFREGGRRKISTLSGGETFMVSLAMALGLAEMTRGQAEIDSLFIDEGFGTLDQDSLEDVLEMLNQIQTRGLLVGVISHVKSLTSALPVNLVLQKKSDGTSSVSLRFN